MTIQDQAPDLEICQEAKEKGVEIKSSFWWENITGEYRVSSLPSYQGWMNGIKTFDNCLQDLIESGDSNVFPAPLIDEILEKLPVYFKDEKEEANLWLHIDILPTKKVVYYQFCSDTKEYYKFEDKKLSNALLRLAIKLKEEGLL